MRDVLWNGTDSDWLVSAPNTRTLFNDATLKWLHLLGESTETVKRHFFFPAAFHCERLSYWRSHGFFLSPGSCKTRS